MAEAEIRYVAETGRDANPCTQTAPCKTLQRGIDVTPDGGELRVLSSGTYGGATIGKSLTVSGDEPTLVIDQIMINATNAIPEVAADRKGIALPRDGYPRAFADSIRGRASFGGYIPPGGTSPANPPVLVS
jgi:hypothetical protein